MINENYKGKLLISSPEIADGIFDKSIILICEHDANGTIGFVVNKPVENVTLGMIWANLGYNEKNLKLANQDVCIGGPLASNAMFVIHSPDYFIDQKTIKVGKDISLQALKRSLMISRKGKDLEKHFFY